MQTFHIDNRSYLSFPFKASVIEAAKIVIPDRTKIPEIVNIGITNSTM